MSANLPLSEALSSLTDALAFTQSGRLFSLSFAPGSGIDEGVLLPQELSGDEAIGEGLTYTLTCLSADVLTFTEN